ncbi:hypothetical protein SELMODRAFT_111947 [Selaginella moellendorffii]|uniref:Phosphatidic acid phosphatase type 2/haloperoxidase domain-containing protein n=1 Tax=Selaginella moellendorffii TaxID=88036 RepID=D8S9J3_SELML|nr:probable lipid phosphate phosphatase beta [Selaginella moellendorffii]EFJ18828.1 hypothetical protein SELMODRAFT_111947 [Selaginella moellendorffii]|eukprot:XP_002979958.1 probable lipid phosphate phosphatase beta [Selaginella moellendorffii]
MQRVHDLDSKISLWIHQAGARIPRFVLRVLEFSGDGVFWIVAIAALAFAAPSSPQLQLLVPDLMLGFVLDVLLVASIKTIVRRPRPIYNKGMYVISSVDHWSFPSGHSSRALFMATFFWLKAASSISSSSSLPPSPPRASLLEFVVTVEFLALSWAVATAISRVLLGRHYVMDVFVGSSLGVLEAAVVDKFSHATLHQALRKKLSATTIAWR